MKHENEDWGDYGFDPKLVGNRRCPGTMRNGPEKRYVRCDHCHRIDWERNEGDPCPRKLGEAHS